MMRSCLSLARMFVVVAAALAMPASAGLVLSEVIVDFGAGQPPREDIEAWNDGKERMYLVADPVEVLAAGLADEHRQPLTDPRTGGLLVTPRRMILEPGERKLIRVATVGPRGNTDRIYRVAVRPVAGTVSGDHSGVKILVGYDMLVMVRPATPKADIVGRRQGRELTVTNNGNTNAELFDGKQRDARGGDCRPLPARRLYAGATIAVPLAFDTAVEYRVRTGVKTAIQRF